jgi:hypothetical protein
MVSSLRKSDLGCRYFPRHHEILVSFIFCIICILLQSSYAFNVTIDEQEILSKLDVPLNPYELIRDGKFDASITKWDFIDTKRKFTILSMSVDHHSDGSWYIPSLHDKFSIGWNRTVEKGFMNRPNACVIRFYGLALESAFFGFEDGGTGFFIIGSANGKYVWHGVDRNNNETAKTHCYYQTNKNHASDFIDEPKTYAFVVHCPIALDQEIGIYSPRARMHQGYFCRILADWKTKSYLRLRPTNFHPLPAHLPALKEDPSELEAEFFTSPQVEKMMQIRNIDKHDHRPHAVCTVQTFRNAGSGKPSDAFYRCLT